MKLNTVCYSLFFLTLSLTLNSANSSVAESAAAQHSVPTDSSSSFSADSQTILRSAAAISKQANADVIVLLDEQRYFVDEQGRARNASHMIYRVDTATGVEQWASVGAY